MVQKSQLLFYSSFISLASGIVVISLAAWNASEVEWSPLTNAIAIVGGVLVGVSLLGIINSQGCTFCCNVALHLYIYSMGILSLAGIAFVITAGVKKSDWVEEMASKYADMSDDNIEHLRNKYDEFMPYVIAFGCVTVFSCVLGFLAGWRYLRCLSRQNEVKREIVTDRRDRRQKAEREKVKKKHHETIVQMTEKYKNRRDPEGRLLKSRGEVIGLNPLFRHQLLSSLAGQGAEHTDVTERVAAYLPTEAELIAFANERWEALLMYMSGETSFFLAPPSSLHVAGLALDRLLEYASLGEGYSRASGVLATTSEGYRFLLLDQASQLWKLISQYIIAAETEMSTDLGKLCSFLLELGFRPVNKPGDVASLDPIQHKVATHMEQLGVLKTFSTPSGAAYYVPTPLASCFCADSSAVPIESKQTDTVAVETNFKVYGYTKSNSFRKILDLFCRCDYTVPELYAGTITRESMSEALDRGLSAELIIHYLHSNAHSRTRNRSPTVPDNVMDQLRLWEKDIHRVKTEDAVLFEHFSTDEDFLDAVQFAKREGMHLWNDSKSKLIIHESGNDLMSTFIQTSLGKPRKRPETQPPPLKS